MALVEICVDHVDSARIAEEAGADRVEVCAGLVEDGTTPSIGLVSVILRTVRRVGVRVLIRPRGGDFVYSPGELDVMAADIGAVRALSGDVGFVIGALTAEGEVDVPAMRLLVAACGGAPVTFHKAFDATVHVGRSLDALLELGIGRVLTSGGHPLAVDGIPALAGLVRQAGGRIAVMAGGGVRPPNVREIVERTGVPEVHLRATDPAVIRAVLRELRSARQREAARAWGEHQRRQPAQQVEEDRALIEYSNDNALRDAEW